MEDSVIRIPRQSCCRLCLAPDSECVSIFGTRAADKQPISSKIQACVNIQVNASDRLSGRVCHGCISFLNSWTSFKGRCLSAQREQKSWLAAQLKRQLGLQAAGEITNGGGAGGENGEPAQPMNEDETEAYNYYPQYNRKKANNESKDDEDTGPVTVNMELDPTQFLSVAGGDDDEEGEDDDELEEGEFVEPSSRRTSHMNHHSNNNNHHNHPPNNAPQILNALGLRNVNPMSMLATDLLDDLSYNDGADDGEGTNGSGSMSGSVPPSHCCRSCGMKFSNRANARRHERNLHGIVHGDGEGALPSSVNGATPTPTCSSSAFSSSSSSALARPQNQSLNRTATGKGIFEYSKPQKYRHLLTEARLQFIRVNARFLRQYQDMTCKCCDRKYFTYKTFMAHMRKKYETLPRNVCFNCLRKFETKGMFIAHLKKRDCINLFTVYMADDTIPKDVRGSQGGSVVNNTPSAVAGGNRIGLKDLLSNKMYACLICKEQLRLKNDFRQHVANGHPELQGCRDPATGNCRHCQATFADPQERKRHFSSLDCLLVIICTTCNNQFPTNAIFLDHVYGTHLKELNAADEKAAQLSTERLAMPKEEFDDAELVDGGGGVRQNLLMPKKNAGCVCPICQKQYNNFYNVLWHFESKHPEHVPKTYKCEICATMFTKQALLKSHVKEEHANVLTSGGSGESGGGSEATVGKYPCRHCDEILTKATEYVAHQLRAHPDEELLACHECEFVTEQREKLEEHLRGQHLNLLKLRVLSCGSCKQSFVTEDALKYHAMVQHAENESSEQMFRRMLRMGRFPKVEPVEGGGGGGGGEQMDLEENGDDADDELLQDTSFMARVKYEESQRVRECPICVDKYAVLAEFIAHMNGHVAADNVTNLDLEPGKSKSGAYHSRMRCRMCEKRISSKVGYKRHLLEAHGVDDCKIVQCDLCPGEFSNEKGLRVHLFRTHNICVKEDGEVVTGMQVLPPPTGDSQLAVVAAQLALKQQQQQRQQQTIEYECQICHTVYRSLGLLRSHVGSVHQMNDFDAYLQQHGNGEVTTTSGGGGGGNAGSGVGDDHQLDAMSLMMMTGLMDAGGGDDGSVALGGGGTDYTPIEVYFQCRYCDENFASRQKLTAHMNTHEEHDPTDYTCRECGNVYQSRKSLWVHRNKKHPRSQVPSPCEVCKKVFFDKTELVYHLKTHVAQRMELMNEMMSATQNGGVDDDDEEGESSEGEEGVNGGEGVKKYDCHVCERKFRDAGKLSQHLRYHEMQNNMFVLGAFTEAGMDDDLGGGGVGGGGSGGGSGGGGSNSAGMNEATGDPFEPQYNEDGSEEYQCDMCPKKFSQLMALRVHRGWHYRSPDGRQITEPGQTWQPGSLRSQRGSKGGGSTSANRNSTTGQQQAAVVSGENNNLAKINNNSVNNNNNLNSSNNNNNSNQLGLTTTASGGSSRLPKCQFCSSTFASSNNLRRHIVEVHKRSDWRATAAATTATTKSSGGSVTSGGFVDRDRECQACNLKFETRAEWVEHKIGHARVMRPSTTFEWNCEMCGKVFTRKERLLQHMASHAGGGGGQQGGQRQSQALGDSGSENSRGTAESNGGEMEEEEEELDDDDEPMVVNPDVEMLTEEDDDEDLDEGEVVLVVPEKADQQQSKTSSSSAVAEEKKNSSSSNKALCCDLCQVSFTDAGDLRKHVLSHFFNGTTGGDGGGVVAAVKAKRKEGGDEKQRSAIGEGKSEKEEPQAKKAKIDIPEVVKKEVKEDQFDGEGEEEEEEGEYVQKDETLGGDLTAGDMSLNEVVNADEGDDGDEEGEEDDMDEGEYVEEYFDEESLVSPKKVTPAKAAGVATVVTTTPTAACRLCSSAYENNFKALKCMESHRQRSKYQCTECELYFATPKQLTGHEQLMHGK